MNRPHGSMCRSARLRRRDRSRCARSEAARVFEKVHCGPPQPISVGPIGHSAGGAVVVVRCPVVDRKASGVARSLRPPKPWRGDQILTRGIQLNARLRHAILTNTFDRLSRRAAAEEAMVETVVPGVLADGIVGIPRGMGCAASTSHRDAGEGGAMNASEAPGCPCPGYLSLQSALYQHGMRA